MFESLVTILSSAAVSAVLAGAVVWLLQNWISERLKNAIKHEYDAKLESHKAQLKAALDTELETYKARLSAENAAATERLKSQLQIAASEHQIRFAKLHEKMAEVVAETYARLYQQASAVEQYVSVFERADGPSKKDRRFPKVRGHEVNGVDSDQGVRRCLGSVRRTRPSSSSRPSG